MHRFQESKLVLYNSVPNDKTTTEAALQAGTKVTESDHAEIPRANPESSTCKGLGRFSPLLTQVCLEDTEDGVQCPHRGGIKH